MKVTLLQKSFFDIQNTFLKCPVDKYCSSLCNYKEMVGDYSWYYTPPPEYLGQDYNGIVIVGLRPGFPRELSDNPIVRSCVLSYQDDPIPERAKFMNDVLGVFLNKRMRIAKSGLVNLESWGIKLNNIAFLNLFKCRVFESYSFNDDPKALYPCMGMYFLRQIKILKPKLILYLFKEDIIKIKHLNIDPGFGAKYIAVSSWGKIQDSKRNAAIKKKISMVLGT